MTIKEKIDEIFENSENQAQVIIAIYCLFIPDWDNIALIRNWPSIGYELSQHIWTSFMKFDRENHPNVLAGGLWMNSGFSENKKLPPWEIDLSTCEIIYKEKK
jgi:hypothetical protein